MKVMPGPIKAVAAICLGAAATTASCLVFTPSAKAAATSGILFQAPSNGLQSIMNPGGAGLFVSSTTLQCPSGDCSVSNQLGTLFQSATSYTPFGFDYAADNLQVISSTPEGVAYTKDFLGSLAGFTIFGGVNPLASVTITGPASGFFDGTFRTPPDFPNGEVESSVTNPTFMSATIQANGTTYSSAVVGFTAYSKFGWSVDGTAVPLSSASNLWVYVDETSGSSAVPSPLPILGATATFGWARKLRKKIRSVA